MTEDPFIRVVTGKRAMTTHVAKKRFPNESLCGRVLDPEPVTPKGRVKCEPCQTILQNQRTAKENDG
jgi:hypothetical protein